MELRSGTYHILSRIHESGTDYSKRNNHLAHHLAFRAEDAAGLPNPAAILLNWRGWRSKWDEPPRILEPFEKFELQDLESSWASPQLPRAFDKLTDSSGPFTHVFEISILEERKLIEHFRQTINDLPASQRWALTFTSCLLPTDQPQDYAWGAMLRNLPLPYEVDTKKRPISQPEHLAEPSESTPPPKPPPEEEPIEEAESPVHKPAAAMLKKAPKVEIPEEFDHKKQKRPRRPLGKRELSRTINFAIAGVGVICLALTIFFIKSQPNSGLTSPMLESTATVSKDLDTRQADWNAFIEAGYPPEDLPSARATAVFLDKMGEDHPISIITFLYKLLEAAPSDIEDGISVPVKLLQKANQENYLPIQPESYPVLKQLALLPRGLLEELNLEVPEAILSPLSALPPGLFSPAEFAESLQAFSLSAGGGYQELPEETLEAFEAYIEKKSELLTNQQYKSALTIHRAFGVSEANSYLPFDRQGLIQPQSPTDLSAYLRKLVSEKIAASPDPSFNSSAFLAAYSQVENLKSPTPLETATAINDVFKELELDSQNLSAEWQNIRAEWEKAFVREDLMEQTILGYTLESLERAKLNLLEVRRQFDRTTFSQHQQHLERTRKINQLQQIANEANSSKDWVVIGKQSRKVR